MQKLIRLVMGTAAAAATCLALVGSAGAFSANPTSVEFGNQPVGTTVTITVANAPPVAVNDAYSTNQDTKLTVNSSSGASPPAILTPTL